MSNIAIIVTTMLRDTLLEEAVSSMLKYTPDNCSIFIGDQGCKNVRDHLPKIAEYHKERVYYYPLPFDCGLSHARNYLVEQALKMDYEYCIIASDSMIFTEKTKDITTLTKYMDKYDCIGCHLNKANIYWVGNISLIPDKSFCLDFIDRSKITLAPNGIFDCSIIHNFFIAKTITLSKVKWDNALKLAEHEDFFYRYNKAGYKVGWTASISCDRIKTRDGAHGLYRARNWEDGIKNLRLKWGIKMWITYLHRENGFYGSNKYQRPT